MAKRNDIAPYERREARRWTRIADYWPDADAHLGNVHWPKPGTLRDYPVTKPLDAPRRPGRRGLLLPVAAVLGAVVLSIWGSGMFGGAKAPQSAASTTSRGLVFGLCNEGGLTNCVASGDSFYLGDRGSPALRRSLPEGSGARAQVGGQAAGPAEFRRAGNDQGRAGSRPLRPPASQRRRRRQGCRPDAGCRQPGPRNRRSHAQLVLRVPGLRQSC